MGVVPAGWYDIASDAALKIRSAPSLLLAPIMPAASELIALQDKARLEELYFRASKYLACFGIPLVAFCSAVAPYAIRLWLGPGFEQIVMPFRVLLIANYINLMTGPGFLISVGQGNLSPGMKSASVGLGLNIIVSLALVYEFGFSGAVMGTSFALVVASFMFILMFHKDTRTPFLGTFKRAYLKPMLGALGALLIVPIAWLAKNGWGGVCISGLLFLVVFVVLISLMRFFDAFDIQKGVSVLSGAGVLRRRVRSA